MKNVDTIKILIVHYVAWLADTTLNNRIYNTIYVSMVMNEFDTL